MYPISAYYILHIRPTTRKYSAKTVKSISMKLGMADLDARRYILNEYF
jgi:hypothetical protein